jgi:hypothetical protein
MEMRERMFEKEEIVCSAIAENDAKKSDAEVLAASREMGGYLPGECVRRGNIISADRTAVRHGKTADPDGCGQV